MQRRGKNVITNGKKSLTKRQRAFIVEYPQHDTAKEAAIAAGYKAENASIRLMKNPLILQRLDVNAAARRKARRVNQRNVEEELSRLAFANPKDLLDETGSPIPLKDLPRDVLAAYSLEITHIKGPDGTVTEQAKLRDLKEKGNALGRLGDRLGMFDDQDSKAGIGQAYIESLGRTVGPTGIDPERSEASED